MVVATHGGSDPSVPYFRLPVPCAQFGSVYLYICFWQGLTVMQGGDSQAFLVFTLKCKSFWWLGVCEVATASLQTETSPLLVCTNSNRHIPESPKLEARAEVVPIMKGFPRMIRRTDVVDEWAECCTGQALGLGLTCCNFEVWWQKAFYRPAPTEWEAYCSHIGLAVL